MNNTVTIHTHWAIRCKTRFIPIHVQIGRRHSLLESRWGHKVTFCMKEKGDHIECIVYMHCSSFPSAAMLMNATHVHTHCFVVGMKFTFLFLHHSTMYTMCTTHRQCTFTTTQSMNTAIVLMPNSICACLLEVWPRTHWPLLSLRPP